MTVKGRTFSFPLIFSLLFLISPHPSSAADFKGPLPQRLQYPLNNIYMEKKFEDPRVLEKGTYRFEIDVAYTNSFSWSDSYFDHQDAIDQGGNVEPGRYGLFADAEVLRTDLTFRGGLTRRCELSVEVPLLSYHGGFLDSLIEGFHDLTGLPNGGRDLFPQDRFFISLLHEGKKTTYDESPSPGVGDVTLRFKRRLYSSEKGTILAAGALVKTPTGNERRLLGSGGWDLGAELLLAKKGGRSWFHFNLSYYDLDNPESLPVAARDTIGLGGAWELPLGLRLSLLTQVLISTSPYPESDTHDMGDPRAEIGVGLKGDAGEKSRFYVSIVEDLTQNQNTVDFGFIFGFDFRF